MVRSLTRCETRPWWLLLLPLCFLLHIFEERWAGEGFVAWTARLVSSPITTNRFLVINAIGWPTFSALTLLAILRSRLAWLAAALATMLLMNACLHALGTVVTRAYSPGLVTSLLLYPPICIAAIRYSHRTTAGAAFALAVGAGILAHALVLFAAFG